MTIVLPEIDGYQLRHFPTDPWGLPIAYVCDVCGCYVADTEKHTNECQLVTAEPIVVVTDLPVTTNDEATDESTTCWAEIEGWPGGERIPCRVGETTTVHVTQIVTLGQAHWYNQPVDGEVIYGPTWLGETPGTVSCGPGTDILLTVEAH